MTNNNSERKKDMDKDIFKRKWENKGYYFIKMKNEPVIYYPFSIDDKYYTLQTNSISNIEKFNSEITITIYKFSDETVNKEEKIATISCHGSEEINEVLENIESVIDKYNHAITDTVNEVFEKIISQSNIKIAKHRGKWIQKK